MARTRLACVVALLALTSAEQTRWSRQLSTYTSDLSDWVPLPGPVQRPTQIKRQAIAEPRILSEPVYQGFTRPTGFVQDSFPSRNFYNSPANRQLYLQSIPAVPSAPQNYLTDQGFGQNIRFGLSQPNFPLNQGFLSQQFPFDSNLQVLKQRPPTSNPIKFESFPNANLPSTSNQAKPFGGQISKKPEAPQFVDGYRVENATVFTTKKKPQSLQKIKFENFDKFPKTEMIPPNKPKSEREEVQLLYVPLESLNRGQFNFRNPVSSHILNSEQAQPVQRPTQPKQVFSDDYSKPAAAHLDAFSPEQDFFSNYNSFKDIDQVPKFSTLSSPFPTSPPTTPKPKKLKPHQPPLAIFMTQEAKRGNQIRVGDVLSSLKTAETIAVLDSVNPQSSPKVFIGPSSLTPPDNFVKFELPYLSNIEHSEKKIRQLPFFVAPLSYNTPQGFAKIPFPSPHVGSVVINSQIKEVSSPVTKAPVDVIPNYYSTAPQNFKHETRPATTKPTISYYSTVPPKTNPPHFNNNYYSFEPQTVNNIRTSNQPKPVTSPPKTGSYFLSNVGSYKTVNTRFESNDKNKEIEPQKSLTAGKPQFTNTTPKVIVSTTADKVTYPSQLLETHNPFSINHAFHFSTPSDYQNFYEDGYATPGLPPTSLSLPAGPTATPSPSLKPIQSVTDKPSTKSSPSYVQNYSPEIHYESEVQNTRYNTFKNNEYTTKPNTEYRPSVNTGSNEYSQSVSSVKPPTDYQNIPQSQQEDADTVNKELGAFDSQPTIPSEKSPELYNQYETNFEEPQPTSTTTSSTTTTTTTTRRTPVRGKGRPRYTTPRSDSTTESTSRPVVTRRPLRERRPLPTRSRYEPNKITTERTTRRTTESNENTTKYTRSRTRGRVHYKTSESEEQQIKSAKGQNGKDDLAYQRDVLHQNYPVTLMERHSTIDIEAITEPSPKISSTKTIEGTEYYDTDNAYSNDRAAFSDQNIASPGSVSVEDTSKVESQTDSYYATKAIDDYSYQSRSSFGPDDSVLSLADTTPKRDQESYSRSTTPIPKQESQEIESRVTESTSIATDETHNEFVSRQEETSTTPELETKITTPEESREEPEVNVIQTTPSYNRVRVRPGVVRQYHQASSTEATKIKTERRRPAQAVTYRPAFDRRRTTMRIEEIGDDLKTKQVHSRQELEHRHPVYRPESTTEPSATSSSQESTTKRGMFRRRRPSYTTSTDSSAPITKKNQVYEIKNRFRGRRPTEKPTDKPEVQTEASTTTARNIHHSRYSNRPRLSERYNKKPEPEPVEDQDANYSINQPKYIEPESEQWSTKVSGDSFKPFNPNDIVDSRKGTTAFRPDADDVSDYDIITARNDYDEILLTVTPPTNTKTSRKTPDIPPTLEALVEQSKNIKGDTKETMSNFESMLEEVMKNLEEQDEDEYTTNVMKHEGGEIGEIPPERVISGGEPIAPKLTTIEQQVTTTVAPQTSESVETEETTKRRRGWRKKVIVRPVTESIETAESQYYSNTANRVGNIITLAKIVHDKSGKYDKPKTTATTYKPRQQFFTEPFDQNDDNEGVVFHLDIPKIGANKNNTEKSTTEATTEKEVATENPAEMDLGTGSPDPTTYQTTPEPNKTEGFSLMEYLFGVNEDDVELNKYDKYNTKSDIDVDITTEQSKPKISTTETTFVPFEMTTVQADELSEPVTEYEIKKIGPNNDSIKEATEKTDFVETSSVSSFDDAKNVMSTSMSTEVSHETEICFRGKCIKTSRDLL